MGERVRRILTASDDGTSRIWSSSSGECLLTLEEPLVEDMELQLHSPCVRSATYSPNGTLVVTASDDDTAKLWSAISGEHKLTLEGHAAAVYGAVFSPDGASV